MKLQDFVSSILLGENLNSKLINIDEVEFENDFQLWDMPNVPKRDRTISFSEKQIKFPKKGTLYIDENKAIALNSFANHELLAIEMMATALAIFPHQTKEEVKMKRGILKALSDEQLHFSLYRKRMNDLGYEFGDFPLNDFFWKQISKMDTPARFFSVMSLTFEAANLDFAQYYKNVFNEFEDKKTAAILSKVLEDEISHVSLGHFYLNKWRGDKSIWEYYIQNLPMPMTPDRSRGISYDRDLRLKAGVEEGFLNSLETYQDDFKVTKRKSWKS